MIKKHRIVIDTNLWISFLLSKQFSFIDKLLRNRNVQLVFSAELLLEFLDVVKRPKLKRYFAKTDIDNLLEIIEEYAEFTTVTSMVDLCRDKKDNFLLALAKDSSSDYLITGDSDLLVIKKFEETEIITITEYKIKIDIKLTKI